MKHYLAAEKKASEERTKRHKMLINDRKHLDRIENIHEAIAKIANWKSFFSSLDRPPTMCVALVFAFSV